MHYSNFIITSLWITDISTLLVKETFIFKFLKAGTYPFDATPIYVSDIFICQSTDEN